LLLLIMASAGLLCAQQIPTHPYRPMPRQVMPIVFFRTVEWGADPEEYSVKLDGAGGIVYQATPLSGTVTGEGYEVEFPATEATRAQIASLIDGLQFPPDTSWRINPDLPGPIFTLRVLTQSSEQELRYRETESRSIQQLTELFRRISTTLEAGRRLSEEQAAHSTALGPDLARMQQSAARGDLPELQSISGVLRSVAGDTALAPELRRRAEALLKQAEQSQLAGR
jgi:hypothetical protein